jgi:2-methylisocitrate lyase-like PEP mutase family enzyme
VSTGCGQAVSIADATSLTVIADADTGYGGPLNVVRTVRELEGAGVAGIVLEDQTTPKRCGRFAGKQVVAPEEMLRMVRAAVAARGDDELVLIARTDALAVEGFEPAVERARAYLAAGRMSSSSRPAHPTSRSPLSPRPSAQRA